MRKNLGSYALILDTAHNATNTTRRQQQDGDAALADEKQLQLDTDRYHFANEY